MYRPSFNRSQPCPELRWTGSQSFRDVYPWESPFSFDVVRTQQRVLLRQREYEWQRLAGWPHEIAERNTRNLYRD